MSLPCVATIIMIIFLHNHIAKISNYSETQLPLLHYCWCFLLGYRPNVRIFYILSTYCVCMYLENSDCVHLIHFYTLCFIFISDDCTMLVVIWTFTATNVVIPPTVWYCYANKRHIALYTPVTYSGLSVLTFFQLCPITVVFNVIWNKSISHSPLR